MSALDKSLDKVPSVDESSCGSSWYRFHLLFFVGSLAVAFIAGLQVGLYHGGFRADVYYEGDSSPLALSGRADGKEAVAGSPSLVVSLVDEGKAVYGSCVPCHQATGQGVAGQFPPLVGSDWVVGSDRRLIAILLKGVQGPFKVGDVVYNGAMPPWEKTLSNRKIAAVASYIRASWGNQASEISEAVVGAVRNEFASRENAWTESELLNVSSEPVKAPEAAQNSAGSSAVGAVGRGGSGAVASLASDLELGKQTYSAVCAACHQPSGKGLPPVFPNLDGTDYVLGSSERLVAIVLKGISGPIVVSGVTFNGVMPAQEALLSNEKIAAVVSYVRSSFGNVGSAVSAELVASVRKKFAGRGTAWTEKDLLNFESVSE
jgi:mono/diheme cytochrome c family protein